MSISDDARALPDGLELRWLVRACALLALLMVTVVLVGWAVDNKTMQGLVPGQATMKVNTALGLGALAVALLVSSRRVVIALSLAVLALATAVGLQHATGVNLGIDELFVQDTGSGGNNAPGRPAVLTVLVFALLASARLFLLKGIGHTRAPQTLAAVAGALSGLTLVAYIFGAERLYGVVAESTMALNTGVAVVLLAVGTAASVPQGALTRLVRESGPGTVVVRSTLPIALVALPLLGFVVAQGIQFEIMDYRFGLSLLVAATAVGLLAMAATVGRRLDRLDRARSDAANELRSLNALLQEGRDLEWRRAEDLSRSLREERDRFERAIAKVDDVLWTVEIDPAGATRPVFASPSAEGLLGGEPGPDVALTDAMVQMVHPEDVPLRDAFVERLAAGEAADTELRLVGLDGVARYVWTRGWPRREGDRLYVDGITTNVTHQRELSLRREELLVLEQEQVRQLREIDRLREEFLAVTGHELRTPLTSIRGFADLLLADPALSPDQRLKAEVISRRAIQLGKLVDNLFDVTRISAGMLELNTAPVDLREVVTDAVAAVATSLKEAGLVLDSSVEAVTVNGDAVRLRQVVDNLVSNAVKYTPRGGRVEVELHVQGGAAVLTVSDTGIGLSEEDQKLVFDRMFRSQQARELAVSGTGLGLAVSRGLVEAHGGTIDVAGNPGGGSVFTVRLPMPTASRAGGLRSA